MGECGVSEENIKQIFNSKLNGQEQRMIMSYYTQLQRESKETGMSVGINNLILLISGLILSTVASYTAYHIESDGHALIAIIIYVVFYIPVLAALINLWDIMCNRVENKQQRDIINILFIICFVVVISYVMSIISSAVLRL